jgi:hypothetical protein
LTKGGGGSIQSFLKNGGLNHVAEQVSRFPVQSDPRLQSRENGIKDILPRFVM